MGEWRYSSTIASCAGCLGPMNRASGTLWVWDCVGPRASLDDTEKRKIRYPYRESNLNNRRVSRRYTDWAIPARPYNRECVSVRLSRTLRVKCWRSSKVSTYISVAFFRVNVFVEALIWISQCVGCRAAIERNREAGCWPIGVEHVIGEKGGDAKCFGDPIHRTPAERMWGQELLPVMVLSVETSLFSDMEQKWIPLQVRETARPCWEFRSFFFCSCWLFTCDVSGSLGSHTHTHTHTRTSDLYHTEYISLP
jgi:hypothetical protein